MNTHTSSNIPLINPLQEFFKTESSSGIVLMVTTALALIAANSGFSELYFALFESVLTVGFPGYEISKPLILWINDGLMAIFFLLIGLEIKREVKYGELSDLKAAMVPVIAALGGALIPGLVFFAFNGGTEFEQGWAIAIATDIAFAIGILSLVGSGVPLWAKVFLTAVAVVDDLIAVMVIALFYTGEISGMALGVAGVCVIILTLMNFRNVQTIGLYLLVGLVLWVAVLKSGVHATIAGVVLGLLIPARRTGTMEEIKEKAEAAARLFSHSVSEGHKESRETALNYMQEVVDQSESPLYRLEHKLHPWVAYGIIPVFAFANAGVAINAEVLTDAFSSTLTWGIIAGLFIGKQVGISLAVWLMKISGLNPFPERKGTMMMVYGLTCLSGVGFTMSLFISGLSFVNPQFLEFAKTGILAGSVISGILGYILLKRAVYVYTQTGPENSEITTKEHLKPDIKTTS